MKFSEGSSEGATLVLAGHLPAPALAGHFANSMLKKPFYFYPEPAVAGGICFFLSHLFFPFFSVTSASLRTLR
jgi:hypothetical protein